jgi:hypothetical protein
VLDDLPIQRSCPQFGPRIATFLRRMEFETPASNWPSRSKMTADLGQQVEVLETACWHLLLQPDDVNARERVARTLAAMNLMAAPDDGAFVRGLIAEVRAHADSLAFRLEGKGYDCLYISASTALLCQALAQLKLQLPAVVPAAVAR